MTLTLHQLSAPRGRKRRRPIGRGNASGHGTYSGRGQKGQKARTGGRRGLKRRGLKQFLQQLPKSRGFKSHFMKPTVINLSVLNAHFSTGDRVTVQKLFEKKLTVTPRVRIKILGSGKLTKKLTVVADHFSQGADSAIIKAGGKTIYRK